MSNQDSQTKEFVQKRIEQFISTLPQDEKGQAARDGFSLIMKYASLGTPDSLKRAHDSLFKLLVDYPEYEKFRSDIENVLLNPNHVEVSDTEDKKTSDLTQKKDKKENAVYFGKQKKELTKDELFNESIKKLEKELLYNVRLKKTVAPDLFTKVVKRTVVEDYTTSGDPKERQEEYRRTEKKVFDEWCIKHAGKTEAQIKEDHDFRFAVDEAFLKEKSDLLEKARAIEAIKNAPAQDPKRDVVSIALTETLKKIEQAKKLQSARERRKFLKLKKPMSRQWDKGSIKTREQVTSFFIQCFSIRLSEHISSSGNSSSARQNEYFAPTTFTPTTTTTNNEDHETLGNFRLPSIKQPKNYIDRANSLFNKGKSIFKSGPRLGGQLFGSAGRGFLGQAGGSIFGSLLGGGGAAGSAAGAAGAGTAAAGTGGAVALGSNPVGWVILAVIIFIIILVLILLIFGAGDYQSRLGIGGNPVVNISKTVNKESVPNPIAGSADSDITFTINVSYSGNPSQITITDPIPDNAEFVSADNNPTLFDANGNQTTNTSLTKTVKWTLESNANQSSSISGQTTSASFDQKKFESYGFPAPNNPNPKIFDEEILKRWKQVMPQAVIASEKLGVDIGILGWWIWTESNGADYCFENCVDGTNTVNSTCYCSISAGDNCLWQVGIFGNHPQYTKTSLEKAISEMHSGKTIQQIGQAVIDQSKNRCLNGRSITNPSVFPNITTVNELLQRAEKDDKEAKLALATLYKDDGIGAYLLAKHFLDIGMNNNLAHTIDMWDKEENSGHYTKQNVINYIKAVYDAGITGASGLGAGSKSFTITLRPKINTKDTYIINQAFADALGGTASIASKSCAPINKTRSKTNVCSGGDDYNLIGTNYISYELPEASYYNLNKENALRWGRNDLLEIIYNIGQRWSQNNLDNKFSIGDLDNLTDPDSHASHKCGIDVDISAWYISSGNVNGRKLATELGKILMDTGAIKYIFYNDTVVQNEVNSYARSKNLPGEMQYWENHDDHFHVRIIPNIFKCQ